jgi:hypothetical protein
VSAVTELERFKRFASLAGLELEPFQVEMMKAVLGPRREVTISQPRGAGKTTLLGCYGLSELVRHPEATIILRTERLGLPKGLALPLHRIASNDPLFAAPGPERIAAQQEHPMRMPIAHLVRGR